MSNWININNDNNRFRLLCDIDNCPLSICNLLNGRLHVTTVHDGFRHSITLPTNDMVFIVSQFLKSLSKKDRKNLLEFYINNYINEDK